MNQDQEVLTSDEYVKMFDDELDRRNKIALRDQEVLDKISSQLHFIDHIDKSKSISIYDESGLDLRDHVNFIDPLTINYLANGLYLELIFQLNSKVSSTYLKKAFTELIDHQQISIFAPQEVIKEKIGEIIKEKGLTEEKVIARLSDITTLIRPSCQDSGASENYLKRLMGKKVPYHIEKTSPFFHAYQKYCERTQYEILYQEQIMQILSHVFEVSDGQADTLRRAFEKRDESKLKDIKKKLWLKYKDSACINDIKQFWEYVLSASGYLFNKSHAVSYSYITFVTAYIKCMPIFALAIGLDLYLKDKDKMLELIREIQNLNIKISLPKINNTYGESTPIYEENTIYLAPKNIEGVGIVVSGKLRGKYFSSLKTFADYASKNKINKAVISTLIAIDYFSPFSLDHDKLLNFFNEYKRENIEIKEKKLIKKYKKLIYKPLKGEEIIEDDDYSLTCKVVKREKVWEIDKIDSFKYHIQEVVDYINQFRYMPMPLTQLTSAFKDCTLFQEYDAQCHSFDEEENEEKKVFIVKESSNREKMGKRGMFKFCIIKDITEASYYVNGHLSLDKGAIISAIIRTTDRGQSIVQLRVLDIIDLKGILK